MVIDQAKLEHWGRSVLINGFPEASRTRTQNLIRVTQHAQKQRTANNKRLEDWEKRCNRLQAALKAFREESN
ncbi:hypothetical protein [uncultured Fibrella sp.]|uniref:hypothetical protein n=1 Tax=uncultured Fibrella sp. TaxID=1284596 RepID=UPI0035CC34C6